MSDKQVIQELLKMDKDNDNVELTALSNFKNKRDPKYLHLEMRISPGMYRSLTRDPIEKSYYRIKK